MRIEIEIRVFVQTMRFVPFFLGQMVRYAPFVLFCFFFFFEFRPKSTGSTPVSAVLLDTDRIRLEFELCQHESWKKKSWT